MFASKISIGLTLILSLDVASCNIFQKVQQKLERFATSPDGTMPTTDLTREELIGLVNEYNDYSQAKKNAIKSGPASDRQMLHFVVMPTSRVKPLLERKPQSFSALKAAIERNYKRLWPAYHNEYVEGGVVQIKTPKIRNLFAKLEKDVKSLTLGDFWEAAMEAESWHARLLELVEHDDIQLGANAQEFKSIMNMLNRKYYQPLFTDILLRLDEYSDPQVLAREYFDSMWKRFQLKLINGQWTQFSTM